MSTGDEGQKIAQYNQTKHMHTNSIDFKTGDTQQGVEIKPGEKGRDLTQSYDKSPYTNRNVERAKWQHKQRHKKVWLHRGCGPT